MCVLQMYLSCVLATISTYYMMYRSTCYKISTRYKIYSLQDVLATKHILSIIHEFPQFKNQLNSLHELH